MSQRIMVLLGGASAERPISLVTGRACADALARIGHHVATLDPGPERGAVAWIQTLASEQPDVVFNALHGVGGEDGWVQGVLETLGLAYTHSGVLASALAMDKERAKAAFRAAGVDTPAGQAVSLKDLRAGAPIQAPYVLKPRAEGSSFGVFLVREGDIQTPADLIAAVPAESAKDRVDEDAPSWLVEEFIPGRELTVAVMDGRALAVTEIIFKTDFFDYEEKYSANGARHVLPADLPEDVTEACLLNAQKAHAALGCRGLTRSDFRYDPQTGRLALLEINTQPGMTSTSLAPEQAAHVGIDFDDLVAWIVEDASCRR